jgi:hypothetical protein
MKTTLTIISISFFLMFKTQAQVVTQDVNFDFYQSVTNNDFANNFNGITGITQIQTNGITGGCLLLEDSIDWGNDRGIYCTAYKPNSGDTAITGICFKYNSATVVLSALQRAMTIFMHPWADPNHYVIATISHEKKIELITYAWVNQFPPINLIDQHWYQYTLSTAFFPSSAQVYIKAEVFDLGLSGTASPTLVSFADHTISDNILSADTAIQVAISGSTKGGGIYLDNFHFHGRKGFSNCVTPTGIAEQDFSKKITVYPTFAKNTVTIKKNYNLQGTMKITVFNIEGQELSVHNTNLTKTDLDVSSLSNGIYFIKCEAANEISNVKIFVSK